MTFPYAYFYDFGSDGRTLGELRPLLGEKRFEYCNQMKNVKAGLCSAYAFLLLRYALIKEYGIADIPSFGYGEHGKPFLSETSGIHFNFSHSGTFVVCAVSDSPVGADIQDIRPLKLNTGKKFLTEKEYSVVSEIADPYELSRELCRLWCIKESYGKFTGKGFSEGFCSIGAQELINSGKVRTAFRNGAFISVCRE